MIPPIVEVDWLVEHPEAIIVDTRWLMRGPTGAELYAQGHIPNAVFIDLDTYLAAPPTKEGGRHPLPTPEVFATGMNSIGVNDDSVVVAYDDAGGFSAGRLVWMLRRLGISAALLNGGMKAWPGELTTELPTIKPGNFTPRPWPPDFEVSIDQAIAGPLVVDARAAERYRGETEPTDAQPGHIPGALNRPIAKNLDEATNRFLAPEQLAEQFAKLGITDASEVISYCGSGVTACHNLLAMEYADLGVGRLYTGSWSAYSASGRPIATGAEPGQRPA